VDLLFFYIDHARVYHYIAQHFLATLMRPCRYSTKTVKFSIGEEEFVVHSNVVHEPGFTQILTRMAVYEDMEIEALLDGLKKGQKLPIKYDTKHLFLNFTIKMGFVPIFRVLRLVERMTVPPDYLTESELVTLMEQNHIGTDGSIPTHINKINELEYVKVRQNTKYSTYIYFFN
jgi:DNA topoisomerase-3